MTIQIGRAAIVDAASNVQQQGDLLSFDITITKETTDGFVNRAKGLRQRLLGMMNNEDEDVFPLLSSDDPSWDGYYRVLSISVEPFPVFLASGAMRASFSLQRVAGGYANPAIETYAVSRVATNSHSITAPDHALVISHLTAQANIELDRRGMPMGSLLRQPTGVHGQVNNYYDPGGNSTGYSVAYTQTFDYYRNACSISHSTQGWVMGRQFPTLTAGERWSMTNDFVDVRPTGVANNLEVGVWDPVAAAFEYYTVRAGSITAGSFTASSTYRIEGTTPAPIVLRNSPEACSIRVTNGVDEPTFTFTLLRGAMVLFVVAESVNTSTVAIGLAPTAAGTNITGGVRSTSNNASGNRFVILNRGTVSTSTTHTAARATAVATQSVFGLAVQLGGSAAVAPWTDLALLEQLCAPPQWQQRVSER